MNVSIILFFNTDMTLYSMTQSRAAELPATVALTNLTPNRPPSNRNRVRNQMIVEYVHVVYQLFLIVITAAKHSHTLELKILHVLTI